VVYSPAGSSLLPRFSTDVHTLKKRTRTGRLWAYLGDDEHPYTVFDYRPTRERKWPELFLGDWRGFLQADAYAGYDAMFALDGMVEVACWAHARRKFIRAQDTDAARAAVALAFIKRLYKVEREATARALDADDEAPEPLYIQHATHRGLHGGQLRSSPP